EPRCFCGRVQQQYCRAARLRALRSAAPEDGGTLAVFAARFPFGGPSPAVCLWPFSFSLQIFSFSAPASRAPCGFFQGGSGPASPPALISPPRRLFPSYCELDAKTESSTSAPFAILPWGWFPRNLATLRSAPSP